MRYLRPRSSARWVAPFFALCLFLTGCTDSFVSSEAPDNAAPRAEKLIERLNTAKLHHAHLLERGTRPGAPGKYGNESSLNLIIAIEKQSALERYAVLERFKNLERYEIIERYEYNEVIGGYAITIEDSLGLSEYNAFLDELEKDEDISWYEPDFGVLMPTGEENISEGGQEIPWSVAAIGGTESWAKSGDGMGTVDLDVYVIDSGIAKGSDDNEDGSDDLNLVESVDLRGTYKDDDDTNPEDDGEDEDGHGTHIAGIIGAIDDGNGLVGVAPGVRLHNYRVLNKEGMADISSVVAAVEMITAQKHANPSAPIVVNMSLGENVGSTAYTALDLAIETSLEAGVVYVVAAGNHAVEAANVTPARVPGAIIVGSHDVNGFFSGFSNYGPLVDILAPGEGIVSLSKSGDDAKAMLTGTSMATAHVTGAAALYMAQHRTATPAEVEQYLIDTAKDFVVGQPGTTTGLSVWVGPAENKDAPPPPSNDAGSLDVRVASGNDDAEEETANGDMDLSSSDLELVNEGSTNQLVGMRFTGLDIPQGATITNAYIQFTVDETNSGTTVLTFKGQDADDAAAFSSSDYDISSRSRTTAFVPWSPMAWNSVGAAGTTQRTPDLSTIIQEIVSRGGWNSGHAMVLIAEGIGERTAESYNGDTAKAPLLHVEWTTDGTPPPPPPPPPPSNDAGSLDVRVASGNDDAEEETANGDMDLSSSDLELVNEGSTNQLVGMRFTGLDIPQGATITNAYIQYTVDETNSGTTVLTLKGQDADDAAAFSSSDYDISSRPRTTAFVPWSPMAWNSVGAAGTTQRTPDLSTIIQEIVSRGGWNSGHAMVLIAEGIGERTAESYNGDASKAPLLHVDWK